jgi:hypothetical protein
LEEALGAACRRLAHEAKLKSSVPATAFYLEQRGTSLPAPTKRIECTSFLHAEQPTEQNAVKNDIRVYFHICIRQTVEIEEKKILTRSGPNLSNSRLISSIVIRWNGRQSRLMMRQARSRCHPELSSSKFELRFSLCTLPRLEW